MLFIANGNNNDIYVNFWPQYVYPLYDCILGGFNSFAPHLITKVFLISWTSILHYKFISGLTGFILCNWLLYFLEEQTSKDISDSVNIYLIILKRKITAIWEFWVLLLWRTVSYNEVIVLKNFFKCLVFIDVVQVFGTPHNFQKKKKK